MISQLLARPACQRQVHPQSLGRLSLSIKELPVPKPFEAVFPEALVKGGYSTRPHVLDYSGPDSGHRCWRLCPGYTDRSPWGKPVLGRPSRWHAVWQRQSSNLNPTQKVLPCLSRSPTVSPHLQNWG